MSWPTHIVSAAGYVFDGDGRILIVKTKNRGWDCTGGQVEEGEDLEEALRREIFEESGVRAVMRRCAACIPTWERTSFTTGHRCADEGEFRFHLLL